MDTSARCLEEGRLKPATRAYLSCTGNSELDRRMTVLGVFNPWNQHRCSSLAAAVILLFNAVRVFLHTS